MAMYAWKPQFAGHRGSYKGVANTAEAYRNGVDFYGYAGLECDVRVTKDNEYVIMHDETTNSLGGSLTVANATLAELKAETLSQTRGGVSYTGQICTVAEYLDICKEKNAFPIIELKWTTGINNNDMTNFPGLMALVKAKGLESKAIFLTSMKQSLEYIRTNYPDAKCQFLTGQAWGNHFDWCVEKKIEPSIQSGYFDLNTVKKFHDAGLKVACWTVNDAANYKKYAEMGIYMMTCDYLLPAEMEEVDEVDFDNIPAEVKPIEITSEVLWSRSAVGGNLPEDFPIGSGTYKTAQQAAWIDDMFYVNDYGTSTLLTFNKDGKVANQLQGTNSHGIATDDAGNLVLRNDGIPASPSKLVLYKKGTTTPVALDFTLLNPAQANFIFASGDLFSTEGGYVYMYPNGMTLINVIKIANGEVKEVTASGALSATGSTAGVVIPIDNDPDNFIYQVRSVGFYRYQNGVNKGDYLTGSATTTAPGRNSSLGGAFFVLGGHEILVHPSGSNYNGGISVKDMSAAEAHLVTFAPLGSAAYAGNPSTGCFIKAEQVSDNTYHLYEYCMGNGIAAYKISLASTGTGISKPATGQGELSVYPNPVTDVATVRSEEAIDNISLFNLSGIEMMRIAGNGEKQMTLQLGVLPAGSYLIRIGNGKTIRFMKR